MAKKYDFVGWATRANILCSDGRTIMRDAFKDCDGKTVPLVWNHNHATPETVLGHALLRSVDGDMKAYCSFNDTPNGQDAKALLDHGDITALSIYANNLTEQPKSFVTHGIIREVSLVLAPANPGACIDSVIQHSDGTTEVKEDQGWIYTGEPLELYHSDESDKEDKPVDNEKKPPETKEPEEKDEKEETIKDVFDTLTDKQKTAVYAIVGKIAEDSSNKKENSEEDKEMKHNAFERDTDNPQNYLSHADGQAIIAMAKANGGNSLMAAADVYIAENGKDIGMQLSHADGDNDNGFANIDQLFPEYKLVKPGAPEMLTTDQGWIGKVLAKTKKSPMSRLRVRYTDARDISGRRAQGYSKGTQKQFIGNLKLLGRTVDPTTVYILDKLDRDDKIDITDFDIVNYMYQSQRMNLNEELARQIMIGDGRVGDISVDDGKKIDETKIIPIWGDDELFTMHVVIDVDGMRTEMNGSDSSKHFGDNYVYSEAVIQKLLYSREKYKGSGSPDFFCAPHLVNVMLLARDLNGRRIYDNVTELKAAMNINELITAEQFEGKTRTVVIDGTEHTRRLLGILVNLTDYTVGSTKGGEITHFTDFDLRFNQDLSLLETRLSGMLTRPFSAIVLEEEVVNP